MSDHQALEATQKKGENGLHPLFWSVDLNGDNFVRSVKNIIFKHCKIDLLKSQLNGKKITEGIVVDDFNDDFTLIKNRLSTLLEYPSYSTNTDSEFEPLKKATEFGLDVTDGILTIFYNSEKTSYYSIDLNEPKDQGTFVESDKSNHAKITELQSDIDEILSSMDKIITSRNWVTDWELTNEDILEDSESQYNGLYLEQLKEILNIKQRALAARLGEKEKSSAILGSYEKRMELLFGLSEDHEDSAGYFNIAPEEAKLEVHNFLKGRSIEDTFSYIKKAHIKIDKNDNQSAVLTGQYSIFFSELYNQFFEKIKKITPLAKSKKIGLQLAMYVTGRVPGGESFDMDDNLRDPNMANTILGHYIFNSENSILSRINSSLIIEDEKVGKSSPKEIISDSIEQLTTLFKGKDNQYTPQELLIKGGFGSMIGLLNRKENPTYDELTLEEKTMISTLVRLNEKLKGGGNGWYDDLMNGKKIEIQEFTQKKEWYEFIDKGIDLFLEKPTEQMVSKYIDKSELTQEIILSQLFSEVSEEGFQAVQDSINENFDADLLDMSTWGGKDSEDLGLDQDDAEIFDLFQDINGNNGILDISDANIENWKMAGKVGGGLALTLALGAGVLAVVGTGAITTTAVAKTASGAILLGDAALKATGATILSLGNGSIAGATATSLGTKIAIGSAASLQYTGVGLSAASLTGVGGSLISTTLSGEGYETTGDGIRNIGTDVITGGVTGAAGQVVTAQVGKAVASNSIKAITTNKHNWHQLGLRDLTQTEKTITNVGAFGLDAGVLGFGTELLVRTPYVEAQAKAAKHRRDTDEGRTYADRLEEQQNENLIISLGSSLS